MRDRAAELVDEEAALAERPGDDLGGDRARRRQRRRRGSGHRPPAPARSPSTASSPSAPARVASLPAAAEPPHQPVIAASGWPAALGDAAGLARRLGALDARGLPHRRSAPRGGGAPSAWRTCSRARGARSTGSSPPSTRRGPATPARSPRPGSGCARRGSHVVVAPLDRGFVLESRPGRRARRARRHRAAPAAPGPAGARRARSRASSTTWRPGSYVVHHVHGVARYGGMVDARDRRAPSATTCCSSTAAATGSTSPPTRSTPSRRTRAASSRRSTG